MCTSKQEMHEFSFYSWLSTNLITLGLPQETKNWALIPFSKSFSRWSNCFVLGSGCASVKKNYAARPYADVHLPFTIVIQNLFMMLVMMYTSDNFTTFTCSQFCLIINLFEHLYCSSFVGIEGGGATCILVERVCWMQWRSKWISDN